MNDFHQKVIYQVYPKSFRDSNGDGVGDLLGVTEKIPYLAELGIDMIWLNPFYVSPQKDNGYDVANYIEIDPLFGTMADFELLVKTAKSYDIEIMLDMVLNHTSIQHEWFQKALAGDKAYEDFYITREGKADGSLPTNWESKFVGPAWEKFGETNRYYLRLFDVTQGDLNWKNPDVRDALYDVVNFWIAKGVTGFRFDVVNLIDKPAIFEDDLLGDGRRFYTDGAKVHDYLKELNQRTFGKLPEAITVGEMSSTTIKDCVGYSNPNDKELSMTFSFHHLKVDYVNGQKWSKMPFDFMALKGILHDWQVGMAEGNGWNALFWNNHDQPRALSRFGNDTTYRVKSAQMLAASIHLLRGTPYIYQGEEIGMTNPYFDNITTYQDVESQNAYHHLTSDGHTTEEAMAIIKDKSRDNSRTPMQWDASENGGFTTGKPWLSVAANYHEINVENELKHGEIFSFYQKLIQLRKAYPIISIGDYQGLLLEHPTVFAYLRTYKSQQLVVLNNFYDTATTVTLPEELLSKKAVRLIGNDEAKELTQGYELAPYETVAFLIG
ncbi:alpha,alpha-phosphotrehalase [Isobaculum melis]|uniref:Alpha,alpha-phosphotrehalase n=1 Tax=Isobaculum melis TaxID=142588 RepID=A0A1H9U6C9_9LACT|nr:alpha,alpha-phosphotrehalase [Isobaculum melis]SES04872.1 trehalose-6-phosphate hydrolase [Isobaculum melis]